MAKFTLRYQLMAGFLAVIFFVGLVSYYSQESAKSLWSEKNRHVEILALSQGLAIHNLELFNSANRYAMSGSGIESEQAKSAFFETYAEMISELDELENKTEDKYSVGILRSYSIRIMSDFESLTDIHESHFLDGSNNLFLSEEERNILVSIEDARVKIKGAREMIVMQADRSLASVQERMDEQEYFSRILLLSSVLLGFALSAYITSLIVGRINDLGRAAAEIGKGNLNVRVKSSAHDELGELGGAFNSMAEGLNASRAEILLKSNEAEKAKLALQEKVNEFERFSRLTVGRELKMEELKKQIAELKKRCNNKDGI